MRLLHTSDWHLGRSLHGADLGPAQAAFLDHLVSVVRTEAVDVVAVCGDVYDRAIPSLDAVALCEDALVRLRDAGAHVVVISGNHDSPLRLGFGARLLTASGVHLRTRPALSALPVELRDAHGPVAVYAVPYLEPETVRGQLPLADGQDAPDAGHLGVLRHVTDAARADLVRHGRPRSLLLAHGWVSGGASSDSERDITVGGLSAVPATLFDDFSYVALGHLHGPQTLDERLRYSGSPLAYSFSEATHRKGSWLVELDAAGAVRVEQVAAPVQRALTTLRGTLDDLLTSSAHTDAQDSFVAAALTDAARPAGAMDRLRARFPHVLAVTWEPAAGSADPRSYRTRVRGRTDLEIATGFIAHVRATPAEPVEVALLDAAITGVRLAAEESAHDDDGQPALFGPSTGGHSTGGPFTAGPDANADVA